MNTLISKYLTNILLLKNRNNKNSQIFIIMLPIILLLVAVFMGNVFMNGIICLTIPFVGAFVALESFLKKQTNPYTYTLNPYKEENSKIITDSFKFFNMSSILTKISTNLLIIQLILGDFNILNIITSIVLLGIVLFFDNVNSININNKTNKDKIMDVMSILIVSILTILVKIFKNTTLMTPAIFLLPVIIILMAIVYTIANKKLNILVRETYDKKDKVYVEIEDSFKEGLKNVKYMNNTPKKDTYIPHKNRGTTAERRAKAIESQERIRKIYGLKTGQEIVEEAIEYRMKHATMSLGGKKVTPEEYDSFCKMHGYGKYSKKNESADTLAKKEKTGGYVNIGHDDDSTDRFNRKRR